MRWPCRSRAAYRAHLSSTQVSLVPPPWLELTTRDPRLSATRVNPPGTMRMRSRPVKHERPQVDMARRDALLDAGRAGRERQRRLRDEVLGVRLELGAERRDGRLVGFRADQHAVAAGAVDLLDDEILDVVEHIGKVLGLAAAPGRHVLEDRLFAEEELHDLRHVAVDRLVVGDAGADRIGERQIAGLVDCHQARHAERGVRPERERVEEVVVDAPVDDVDALEPFGGAHIGDLALDHEVAALDQLDAELVGQEGVLVIGGIVDAGREQHHGRIG